MRRRKLILGTAGATAAAFAGCLGSAQDGDDEGAGGDARTITVSKSGEARADPDLAVVRTAVEATGDDAEEVRDELAERSDALYEALLEYGIDEDDVTTGQFDVRERVDHRQMERDGVDPRSQEAAEYAYYDGTHSFTIDVHDVDDVGGVIDTAIDAGADDVGRVRFTLSEGKREELRERALEGAIEDAREEASFVASNIDASLVEARRIDTSGGDVSPVTEDVEMDDADDAAEPSTELHPDEVTVSATVDVEYEIA